MCSSPYVAERELALFLLSLSIKKGTLLPIIGLIFKYPYSRVGHSLEGKKGHTEAMKGTRMIPFPQINYKDLTAEVRL
jgi:hypothetical protein